MVGWHHHLSGYEFEKPLGNSKGQGSLACCSPWGHKELDMTERLNYSKTLFIDWYSNNLRWIVMLNIIPTR